MVSLAELVLSRDFWGNGATSESMGLDGFNKEQIIEYVMNG
jgi:hypothetical protein